MASVGVKHPVYYSAGRCDYVKHPVYYSDSLSGQGLIFPWSGALSGGSYSDDGSCDHGLYIIYGSMAVTMEVGGD